MQEKIKKLKNKIAFTYFYLITTLSPNSIRKAKRLVLDNKVQIKDVEEEYLVVHAKVESSQVYDVYVSLKDLALSDCNCYAGQEGNYCSHVVAVGLKILYMAGYLNKNLEPIPPQSEDEAKQIIKQAFKFIKPFTGGSKKWFDYQYKLNIASEMIKYAIKFLEPTKETAKYLWKILLRITNKMCCGGLDDSDGYLGEALDDIVETLVDMAKKDKALYEQIYKFTKDGTHFGFEEELRKGLSAS